MIIIGIDPGQKGEVCMIEGVDPTFHGAGSEGLLDALNKASPEQILLNNAHVFLEAAQAMPGQGVSSMFRYGQGYGELVGVLKTLKISYTCVHPRIWTKAMLQGVPTRFEGKQRAAFRAAQLFPYVDLKDSPRCKKPSEGKCDAILIAEYGRRLLI